MARIRDGTFGECAACEDLISTKRLEAVPWAQYCVACHERRERGELWDDDARSATQAGNNAAGAAHQSARTGLFDRRNEVVALDEVDRIKI